MEIWNISKEFDFCYGHRVWSQDLNILYSLDDCLVCRHLHGHQGKIVVEASSNALNKGMVTDFKHFNWLKKFIDTNIDHKFILDKNDPLLPTLLPLANKLNTKYAQEGFGYFDMQLFKNQPKEVIEMYEGFILVDFVPTSENISKWFFDILQDKMIKINVIINSISFFETPKTKSIYKKS